MLSLSRPLVMGIVNVTPDSFSDGGRHDDPARAIAHACDLIAAGADIIDLGGESTRPGSNEVSPVEEMRRVMPVLEALVQAGSVPVSIDTRHAEVARRAIEAGASIINDISGFRDAAMVALAAECDAGLVVMHMLGEPKTMQIEPLYADVVADVRDYLVHQAALLEAAGVSRNRIVIDPGIGFGKTTAQNLRVLRELAQFASTGYPVLVGVSRKRFIGELTQVPEPSKRVSGSVAMALAARAGGAAIVRVHDVAETVQALRAWEAVAEGGHR